MIGGDRDAAEPPVGILNAIFRIDRGVVWISRNQDFRFLIKRPLRHLMRVCALTNDDKGGGFVFIKARVQIFRRNRRNIAVANSRIAHGQQGILPVTHWPPNHEGKPPLHARVLNHMGHIVENLVGVSWFLHQLLHMVDKGARLSSIAQRNRRRFVGIETGAALPQHQGPVDIIGSFKVVAVQRRIARQAGDQGVPLQPVTRLHHLPIDIHRRHGSIHSRADPILAGGSIQKTVGLDHIQEILNQHLAGPRHPSMIQSCFNNCSH